MAQTILSTLSRRERQAIAGTYSLTLLETLCTLAYPAITGWAVDGLLKDKHQGLSLLMLYGLCTSSSPSSGSAMTRGSSWVCMPALLC